MFLDFLVISATYGEICHRNSPDFNECIKKTLQSFIPKFKDGECRDTFQGLILISSNTQTLYYTVYLSRNFKQHLSDFSLTIYCVTNRTTDRQTDDKLVSYFIILDKCYYNYNTPKAYKPTNTSGSSEDISRKPNCLKSQMTSCNTQVLYLTDLDRIDTC